MGWDLQSIALLQHCSLQLGHQTHQLNVLVVPHKRCLKVEQLGCDTVSGLLNCKGRSESFPSFPIHQTITCKCFQLKCYGFYKCMLPWKFNISVFGKNLISDPSPKKKAEVWRHGTCLMCILLLLWNTAIPCQQSSCISLNFSVLYVRDAQSRLCYSAMVEEACYVLWMYLTQKTMKSKISKKCFGFYCFICCFNYNLKRKNPQL